MLEIQAAYSNGFNDWTTVDDVIGTDDAAIQFAGTALATLTDNPNANAKGYRVLCDRGDVAHEVYAATGRACTIQYPAFNAEPRLWTVTIGHDNA